MKSGICPKCGSHNIYSDKGKYLGLESSQLGVSTFTTFTVVHYICADCRYLEKYLDEKWDKNKIEKKWTKI